MLNKSDAQLLREYAVHGSEPAFGEIVARHAGLVYSAALRQSGSPEAAREISQSVFTDLARKAHPLNGELADQASLVGWLYRGTRYAVLNLLRDERRRQERERQVMENFNLTADTNPDWHRVAPVLDEAMAELNDADREAVLLRFFKNQDFHAVGLALGVSDDTAQKRVSRAVERLREFLAKRGVTVGASGLVVVISTNAVLMAPAGLSAAITAAAVAGTTIATTAIAITMTTIQKSLIAAAFAAAVGLGIYQTHHVSRLRDEVARLRLGQTVLGDENRQLAQERDQAIRRSAASPVVNVRPGTDQTELLRLRSQVTQLSRQLAELNKPVVPPPRTLQNGERRRVDDFHDVGAATAEAAFESLLWAAKNAPEKLTGLVHLPEEVQGDPQGLATAGTGLAGFVTNMVFNGQYRWEELSLRGGGETSYVETSGGRTNAVFDHVRSFFLVAWDAAGRETENHNTILFRQFEDGNWRLMIPNFSPSTTSDKSKVP